MSTRVHSVGVIYIASLLQGAVFVGFPALSRVLTQELGISETLYGSLYVPMVAVGAVVSFIGTSIARKVGIYPLLASGFAANAVAMIGLATLPRVPTAGLYPALLTIALLMGVSLGVMGIALNTGAMKLFPRDRSRALAVLHAALGLGAAGGPLVYSSWNARGFWEGAPILFAGLTGVLLAISRWRPIEGFDQMQSLASDPWRNVPRRLWSRGGTAFLYGVAESTLAAWAILFLTQHRAVSEPDAAGALSAFWLCMTAGRLACVIVLRRVEPFPLVTVLLIAMAVMFPVVTTTGTGVFAIFGYGLAGLACSAVFPILMGLASEEAPEHLPQVSSILSACLLIGLGLGSFWVGPLSTEIPMSWVLRLSAIWPVLLLGAVIALRTKASIP